MSRTAIVVCGGGQTPARQLPPFVQARFDAALQRYYSLVAALPEGSDPGATWPVIITLSAGTTHKPNPRDSRGFESKEAAVGSLYVLKRTGALPISDDDAAAGVAPPEEDWVSSCGNGSGSGYGYVVWDWWW